ncbi:MAG: hypothetical protein WCF67_09245, partial [Chitinophagaceae bacterium]
MRIVLLFLALGFSSFAVAQAQADLFSGFWTTSNTLKSTIITATPTASSRIYRIECLADANDGQIYQAQIFVDGVQLTNPLVEGSHVMVEGKSIAIRQVGTATLYRGIWKVIQPQDAVLQAERSTWISYPSLNRDILVASFKTEQEFVLTINQPNIAVVGGSMIVTIDGNVVKDSAGNTVVFSEGSSVYGKGK